MATFEVPVCGVLGVIAESEEHANALAIKLLTEVGFVKLTSQGHMGGAAPPPSTTSNPSNYPSEKSALPEPKTERLAAEVLCDLYALRRFFESHGMVDGVKHIDPAASYIELVFGLFASANRSVRVAVLGSKEKTSGPLAEIGEE